MSYNHAGYNPDERMIDYDGTLYFVNCCLHCPLYRFVTTDSLRMTGEAVCITRASQPRALTVDPSNDVDPKCPYPRRYPR